MELKYPRLQRESRTVRAMIALYCRRRHGGKSLCPECRELTDYADKRLARCVFQEKKPACGKCPVHCYQPEKRQQIRNVMRFAGPRMLFYHPVMAIMHFIDSAKKVPSIPTSRAK
jgi:hypothetical protein